jgi:hypothetical protein
MYALNIKQFDNANDASNFYNRTSFGYNPYKNMSSNSSSPYAQVMGHAPTIARMSTQIVSLNLVSATMNMVAQADEFVIYGTMSVAPTIS